MNWTEQCIAIIPCHNEAEHLAEVIAGARCFLSNVIVVDDGSSDATAQIAMSMGVDCVRLPGRQGKGAALLAGFARAKQMGFFWVLTLDGDGQHSPEHIPAFFAQAGENHTSAVIGNRMGEAHCMPVLRRLVNRLMSRWLSRHTRCHLPDSQCGFRLLRLDALHLDEAMTRCFEFESEMLVNLARRGERIDFVPIRVIYHTEQSKIRAMPDTWRWLKWWRNNSRISTAG